ncbi:MAG: PQQ-like beta-propeller repeat protein [Roseiflexus sp.]|nr:PQQ-like beta-propeller repeat protein [Roseiflexus sp.]
MNTTGQRGLWMIAILAFLGAIGYVALRPPSSAPIAPAPSDPTTAPVAAAPVVPANPFTQPAAVHSERNLSGDWAMEGLNPARTRAVETPIAPPLNQQRVIVTASFEEGVSPPVIARGLMLLETKDALNAIDMRTGRQRWAYRQKGAYISPAIAGDTVYFRAEQANQGQLVALELSSGRQRWTFTPKRLSAAANNYFGGHLTSPVVVDGIVYVGAGKELYALDAINGKLRWEFSAQDFITSSAAVADGRVFVSDFSYFYAIDQNTGRLIWSYPAHSAVYFSSVATGDLVLISSGQNMIALDVRDGVRRWEKSVPGKALIPAGAQGDIVFVKTTNELFALNRGDGRELWSFRDVNYVSLPALTQEYVFIVNGMGAGASVAALDLATGATVWSQAVPRLATTAPVIAGRAIYVRTTDGRVIELLS